jgi:hypothetical protein
LRDRFDLLVLPAVLSSATTGQALAGAARSELEHDPEKWMPVFRKDHAPTKKLDNDPIQFDRIMV